MADMTNILITAGATLIVTIAAALVGALLQSRREHSRWLREQQLEALTNMLTVFDRWHTRFANGMKPADDTWLGELAEAEVALDLVGSANVKSHTRELYEWIYNWWKLNDASEGSRAKYSENYWSLRKDLVLVGRQDIGVS